MGKAGGSVGGPGDTKAAGPQRPKAKGATRFRFRDGGAGVLIRIQGRGCMPMGDGDGDGDAMPGRQACVPVVLVV